MRIMSKNIIIIVVLSILTACTQNPARVVNKGTNWYGKSPYENDNTSNKRYSSSRVGQVEEGPEVEDVQYADHASLDSVKSRDLSPVKIESRTLDAPDAPAMSNIIRERPKPADEYSSNTGASSRELPPLSSVSFEWPISGGKIISHFGQKNRGESNDGINIEAQMNEPIWASADGVVVYSGNELKGFGNMVILRHSDGWMSAYAHADSISVRKNDVVKQGDVIGYVGKSGGTSSPQLHFGIRQGKEPVDPENYLPKK